MGNIKSSILTILLVFSAVLITPTKALAVIQSLNSQTGQTQTFQNDSNVTISSSSNTHSLGWQGLLPFSRGGTGASSFTAGSLLFSNGTSISQNNSNLFWDDTNNRLGIGTSSPSSALDVNGNASILGSLEVTDGLDTSLIATNTDGIYIRNQGSIIFTDPNEGPNFGVIRAPVGGKYFFSNTDQTSVGILNFTGISGNTKNFTFPNASGTFGLLEPDQTWNGLNKFEAGTNSTIYIGSSAKSGCIALGDSDGNGITYVTANDGVLTASTTKPSTCQ